MDSIAIRLVESEPDDPAGAQIVELPPEALKEVSGGESTVALLD